MLKYAVPIYLKIAEYNDKRGTSKFIRAINELPQNSGAQTTFLLEFLKRMEAFRSASSSQLRIPLILTELGEKDRLSPGLTAFLKRMKTRPPKYKEFFNRTASLAIETAYNLGKNGTISPHLADVVIDTAIKSQPKEPGTTSSFRLIGDRLTGGDAQEARKQIVEIIQEAVTQSKPEVVMRLAYYFQEQMKDNPDLFGILETAAKKLASDGYFYHAGMTRFILVYDGSTGGVGKAKSVRALECFREAHLSFALAAAAEFGKPTRDWDKISESFRNAIVCAKRGELEATVVLDSTIRYFVGNASEEEQLVYVNWLYKDLDRLRREKTTNCEISMPSMGIYWLSEALENRASRHRGLQTK